MPHFTHESESGQTESYIKVYFAYKGAFLSPYFAFSGCVPKNGRTYPRAGFGCSNVA